MNEIIIFDIDGVLNYYPKCWIDFINETQPTFFRSKQEAKNTLGLNRYRDIKHLYRSGDYKFNIKFREEAIVLAESLVKKGYNICVATSRPFDKYPTLKSLTERWLSKNNFVYNCLIDKTVDSLKQVKNIRAIIEDELEFAEKFAEQDYRVFLFNDMHYKSLHTNITKVNNIENVDLYL